jgi:hypothetical protein
MATAVTARVTAVPRETSTYQRSRNTTTRTRPRRRVRSRANNIMRAFAMAIGLAFLFGYASVYANLAKTGYTRSELSAMCRRQRIENERLRVEMVRRSSPNYVVAAAKQSGMIPATQYDYLNKPRTVASAKNDNLRAQD